MIVAMKVRTSFSHEEFEFLRAAARKFAEEFSGVSCEFFYYLKPSETDRFFFIRAKTKDKECFVNNVEIFASILDFQILPSRETKLLLHTLDLNSFS